MQFNILLILALLSLAACGANGAAQGAGGDAAGAGRVKMSVPF